MKVIDCINEIEEFLNDEIKLTHDKPLIDRILAKAPKEFEEYLNESYLPHSLRQELLTFIYSNYQFNYVPGCRLEDRKRTSIGLQVLRMVHKLDKQRHYTYNINISDVELKYKFCGLGESLKSKILSLDDLDEIISKQFNYTRVPKEDSRDLGDDVLRYSETGEIHIDKPRLYFEFVNEDEATETFSDHGRYTFITITRKLNKE